jgi:hypothetical protein
MYEIKGCKHEPTWAPLSDAAAKAKCPRMRVYMLLQRQEKALLRNRPAKISYRRLGNLWYVCQECVDEMYGETPGELLVEPIQAYRVWTIDRLGLRSITETDHIWTPGTVTATCKKGHTPPQRKCSCGVYAVAGLTRIPRYGPVNFLQVVGAVDLWGKFVGEDDHGWRAQYGKVTALVCDNWMSADTIHLLGRLYSAHIVHHEAALTEVVWGQWRAEGGDTDGHGQREGARRGIAEAGAGGDAYRAPCRTAAAGASSLTELKRLAQEGVISTSNVMELFEKI